MRASHRGSQRVSGAETCERWQHGHTASGQRSSGAAGMPAGQHGGGSARQRLTGAAQQASGQHARTHARTHARKHAPMHSTAPRQRASGAAKQRGSTAAVQHGSLALSLSAALQRQGRCLMRDFGCLGSACPSCARKTCLHLVLEVCQVIITSLRWSQSGWHR